jgi:S1-C subfamily serine protease
MLKIMILGLLLLSASSFAQAAPQANAVNQSRQSVAEDAPPSRISDSAQRLYEQARPRLLQIRIVLKNRGAQASTGSGFIVTPDGLVVTNYHVISQFALEPEKYRVEYNGPDGRTGSLIPLGIDVRHDLAVLAIENPKGPQPSFEWAASEPRQGDRLYSLGNPLDIGFAVVEGTFNGYPQRGFYPQMLFTGAINPGMSGGPVLDQAGKVVGVNVARHLGGELVSFLVPARFARELAQSASRSRPLKLPAHDEITRQLLKHQQDLVSRTLAKPFRQQTHGKYCVPLLEETYARCWGEANTPKKQMLGIERSNCTMDTSLFTGLGNTGALSVQHEAYDGTRLGTWRFYRQYSASFGNESYEPNSLNMTAAECHEDFVDQHGLPLRAVMCARAHRKFPGLYDVSILVTSLDEKQRGVQGRLDATGVSFDNGLKLVKHYIEGFAWVR